MSHPGSNVGTMSMTWAPADGVQGSLDDLGEPLHETVFVVVDLETTGGSTTTDTITEIGAVKVRGGEVLGEFQTFVACDHPIPGFITRLTGIDDAMLVGQPSLGEAIASFLEFLGSAVLVAHNARFDVGFLKAACQKTAYSWPGNEILDTVKLARTVVGKDEAPNHKLSTLARLFAATVTPEHRALADARATVDVLHGLLERHAGRGVTHRSDLATACTKVPDSTRRKRTLADGLPAGPGVYIFRDTTGAPLYVGRSRNVRSRVRQYFTGQDTRRGISHMVDLAHHVDAVPCATELEGRLRELRLISELAPPYNRRSKRQSRAYWLALSDDPTPVIRRRNFVADFAHARIGPFTSARTADNIRDLLRPGQKHVPDVAALRDLFSGGTELVTTQLLEKMAAFSAAEQFEQAAELRDLLETLLRAADRSHYHAMLLAQQEAVVVRPRAQDSLWEVDLIRQCRHVASAAVSTVSAIDGVITTLQLTADAQDPNLATAEELLLLCQWLGDAETTLYRAGELVPPERSRSHQQLMQLF